MKNPPPVDLHGAVLYHCGPVMLKEGDEWTVKAAGPTTSIREEPYQADVIRRVWRARGDRQRRHGGKTLAALRMRRGVPERHRRGGAILCAHGGEGAGRASDGVRDSGSDVASARKNFAAIVTMDAHGNSLHADVRAGDRRGARSTCRRRDGTATLKAPRPGSSAGRAQP